VSIERQLKEDYQRTGTPEPAGSGAYDRFLRRRARYARRVLAATSLTVAAAVALAVAVPRVLADRGDQVADRPKGAVVVRPELGYELAVPPGWRVAGDGVGGVTLEPATGTPGAAPRGVVAVPTTRPRTSTATTRWMPRPALSRISVESTVLRPGAYPNYPDADRGNWQGGLALEGYAWTPIDGPYREGRRPDGRGFILQGSPRDPSGQRYYVAWPYFCADGVRCPLVLRYRALVLTGWAATAALARANEAVLRRLVDTVRPIGNARPGGAASRPDCRLDWRDQRRERTAPGRPSSGQAVGASVMSEGTVNPAAADFVVTISTRSMAPCRVRASFTVELLEGGQLAAVQGNGATATVEGNLPEGEDGKSPTFTRAWLWRNWCGSRDVSLRIGGPGGAVIPAKRLQRPGCADPGRPSTLESTSLPIRPGG
jgi:hypothetical protein